MLGKIERLITPTVEDLGFDLVRVTMTGADRRTLQIMVERKDETAMTVEDCAKISRAVSATMDVEEPITGAYTLEVSSPGLDRPLVRPRDFERHVGYEIKVEMDRLIHGQRRFSGQLIGFEGETIRMEVDGAEVELPFGDLMKAKLILTDELLSAAASEQDTQENKAE